MINTAALSTARPRQLHSPVPESLGAEQAQHKSRRDLVKEKPSSAPTCSAGAAFHPKGPKNSAGMEQPEIINTSLIPSALGPHGIPPVCGSHLAIPSSQVKSAPEGGVGNLSQIPLWGLDTSSSSFSSSSFTEEQLSPSQIWCTYFSTFARIPEFLLQGLALQGPLQRISGNENSHSKC